MLSPSDDLQMAVGVVLPGVMLVNGGDRRALLGELLGMMEGGRAVQLVVVHVKIERGVLQPCLPVAADPLPLEVGTGRHIDTGRVHGEKNGPRARAKGVWNGRCFQELGHRA